MDGWIAFGVSGWVVCFWLVIGRRFFRPVDQNVARQLKETAREYASQKRLWKEQQKAHDAQMDAIRADIVAFELESDVTDEARLRVFLGRLLSKTKKRGERG